MFAASFLRSTAFSWFQPYLDNPLSPLLDNFELFCNSLYATFGDPDEVGTAERSIFNHRQTTSVAAYASDFRRFASLTSWNDSALCAQFYRGLKDAIKDELAKMGRADTLDQLIEIAIRLDNRMQERKMERFIHTSNPSHRPNNFQSRRTLTMPHYDMPPRPQTLNESSRHMEIDGSKPRFKKLTEEEKQRRKDLGLCLYCGTPGHVANGCPSRPTLSHTVDLKSRVQAN